MLLDKKLFFVKERVALLKLIDVYDIFDPETNAQIGVAVERPPVWAKFLRLALGKFFLPTSVEVAEGENQPPLFSIHKGFAFIRNKVHVFDAVGNHVGYFKSRVFTIGGRFDLFNAQDQQVAELKGDLLGWNFQLVDSAGAVLGIITKKWAGIGKEMFTTADNYMVSLENGGADKRELKILLLAAALAVDTIYKEKK